MAQVWLWGHTWAHLALMNPPPPWLLTPVWRELRQRPASWGPPAPRTCSRGSWALSRQSTERLIFTKVHCAKHRHNK